MAETLILGEIVEKEGIEVTDDEVERELGRIAEQRGTALKEIKQAFYQKEGALEGLKSQIKEHKALDLIYSKAKFEAVAEKETKGEKS